MEIVTYAIVCVELNSGCLRFAACSIVLNDTIWCKDILAQSRLTIFSIYDHNHSL